jgi:hypothetical protein
MAFVGASRQRRLRLRDMQGAGLKAAVMTVADAVVEGRPYPKKALADQERLWDRRDNWVLLGLT